MLCQMMRDFVAKEIEPHAAEWDQKAEFPRDLYRKLGELGIMGVCIPEAYGGSGMDLLSLALAVEEIARADGSAALTVASHNSLCSGHIALAGNEQQKKKYLPALASGQKLGAWGLTEPGSGSDAAGMRTKAVRTEGGWILNGSKIFITQGSVGDIAVILASTDAQKKQHGISAFIVELPCKGFSVGRHLDKAGMRASDTAELFLDDVFVPDENLLGELNAGFTDTLKILDRGRVTIGSLALGLGESALDHAIKYSAERRQFQTRLCDFEALQQMIAESHAELEAARLLLFKAADRQANGQSFCKEAAEAKLLASEAATRACNRAIQIHGGYGYSKEFPVERLWRDAKLCEIGEGTSEILRLVISRRILKGA